MQELKDRICKEGRVLPGSIIKVDGFLNHKIDMGLMRRMAQELVKSFDLTGVTAVLTVEASGIALGSMVADTLGVPLIFAKKAKSDNIEGGLLKSEIYSYTYKKKVTLMVSSNWLTSNDKVFIVDDFLANGEALKGLAEICTSCGAEILGVGIAIEKGFQDGGKNLREKGFKIRSLAIIDHADENGIVFREE